MKSQRTTWISGNPACTTKSLALQPTQILYTRLLQTLLSFTIKLSTKYAWMKKYLYLLSQCYLTIARATQMQNYNLPPISIISVIYRYISKYVYEEVFERFSRFESRVKKNFWTLNSNSTTREIVKVENLSLVRLLDLTADFGVKTNTKLTPDCQREREREHNWCSELSVHSNPGSNFQ